MVRRAQIQRAAQCVARWWIGGALSMGVLSGSIFFYNKENLAVGGS